MHNTDGGYSRDQVRRATGRDVLGLSKRRFPNEDLNGGEPPSKAACLSGLASCRDLLFLSLVQLHSSVHGRPEACRLPSVRRANCRKRESSIQGNSCSDTRQGAGIVPSGSRGTNLDPGWGIDSERYRGLRRRYRSPARPEPDLLEEIRAQREISRGNDVLG